MPLIYNSHMGSLHLSYSTNLIVEILIVKILAIGTIVTMVSVGYTIGKVIRTRNLMAKIIKLLVVIPVRRNLIIVIEAITIVGNWINWIASLCLWGNPCFCRQRNLHSKMVLSLTSVMAIVNVVIITSTVPSTIRCFKPNYFFLFLGQ